MLQPDRLLRADELRAYCRDKLAGHKVPKYVEFCANLPKSTVGKILKRELVKNEHVKS